VKHGLAGTEACPPATSHQCRQAPPQQAPAPGPERPVAVAVAEFPFAFAWAGGKRGAAPAPCLCAVCRQDSMATPGNFGGGSTGPDQIFLGITRAPPSAPGRGRAQSPAWQKPNPQATKHERQTRAARIEGFFQQSTIGGMPVSPSNFRREGACSAFGSWT
jgi:hypothetical protein